MKKSRLLGQPIGFHDSNHAFIRKILLDSKLRNGEKCMGPELVIALRDLLILWCKGDTHDTRPVAAPKCIIAASSFHLCDI